MDDPCSNHQLPLGDIPPLEITVKCGNVLNAGAVCSNETKHKSKERRSERNNELLLSVHRPFCSAIKRHGINYTIVAGEPNWSKSEVLDNYKELVEKNHNLTINITITEFNPGLSPDVDTSKPLYFVMAYGPCKRSPALRLH